MIHCTENSIVLLKGFRFLGSSERFSRLASKALFRGGEKCLGEKASICCKVGFGSCIFPGTTLREVKSIINLALLT